MSLCFDTTKERERTVILVRQSRQKVYCLKTIRAYNCVMGWGASSILLELLDPNLLLGGNGLFAAISRRRHCVLMKGWISQRSCYYYLKATQVISSISDQASSPSDILYSPKEYGSVNWTTSFYKAHTNDIFHKRLISKWMEIVRMDNDRINMITIENKHTIKHASEEDRPEFGRTTFIIKIIFFRHLTLMNDVEWVRVGFWDGHEIDLGG